MKRLITMIAVLCAGVALAGGIAGTVTDAANGNPIANALVVAHDQNNNQGRAFTNEQGQYLIDNLRPGQYRVRAEHRNYQPSGHNGHVEVVRNQVRREVNIQMRPRGQGTGAITGRVVDQTTGLPIAKAVVVARSPNGAGRAVTDRNGDYSIHGLPAGRYEVAATAKHYFRRNYPKPVSVEEGRVTPDINFSLAPKPRRGAIAGQVFETRTHRPLVGAVVIAKSENGSFRAVTDRHGFYRMRLPAGVYRVTAGKRGYETETYPRPVEVRPGQITGGIDFHLHPLIFDRD